jgi:hypothetical protein
MSEVPEQVWIHPAMTAALVDRDVGAVLCLVREHAGWTQAVIAVRTGVSQPQVSLVMTGKAQVTSLVRLEEFADGLGMPDDARMALGLAPRWAHADDMPDDQDSCVCGDPGADGRTCAMHRRQFLTSAGSVAGVGWVADPSQVADLVRRRTGSNVADTDLDDLDLTVEHLVHNVPVRPHHELLPLALRNWALAEGLMEGWQGLGQRRRLITLAGQLSYYVGWLSVGAGRYPQAWQFATLAQRYAAETGDQVLRHSGVVMHSSIAFNDGDNHRRAIEVLRRGDRYATDYTRARSLANAARAHSALGDRESAMTALRDMRAAMVDRRCAQAGEPPFTEADVLLHTTSCLQRLGNGPGAVAVGREAVAAFEADQGSSRNSRSHIRVSLALALTAGDHPDPDEATALGNAVVGSAQPLAAPVVKRLVELGTALRPWARTPEVAVLTDQIATQERLARP